MKTFRCVNLITLLLVLAVFSSGCTKASRKSYHVKQGDKAFQKANYDRAEIEYIKALQSRYLLDLNPLIQAKLGMVYLQEGRVGVASFRFMQPGVTNVAPVQHALALARYFQEVNELPMASAYARWMLSKDPTLQDAMLILAQSTSRNAVPNSLSFLQGLPAEARNLPAYPTALGLLSLTMGDLAQARALFETAVKKEPFPEAYLGLSRLALNATNKVEAEKNLTKAIETSSVRSLARTRATQLLLIEYAQDRQNSNALARALEVCRGITNKAPGFMPVWPVLAQIALVQNDLTNSVRFLDHAISLDPWIGIASLRSSRGELLLRINDAKGALQDFLTLNTNSPETWYGRARAQAGLGQKAEALASVDRAVTLFSNYLAKARQPEKLPLLYAQPLMLQARLNIELTNFAAAVPPLISVTKVFTNFAEAELLLARAYTGLRDITNATLQLRKITSGTNAPAELSAAIVLARLGKTNEALNAFADLLRERANSPDLYDLYYIAATWARGLSKPDQARQWLDEARRLKPDAVEAFTELAWMDLEAERSSSNAVSRIQHLLDNPKNAENPKLWLELGRLHLQAAELALPESRRTNAFGIEPWTRYHGFPVATQEVSKAEKPLLRAIETSAHGAQTNQEIAMVHLTANQLLMGLYLSQEQDKKALAAFDRVSRDFPGIAFQFKEVPFRLGQYYQEKKDFESAVAAYQKAIAADRNNFSAYNNLATVYARDLGKPEEALPHIENGLKVLRAAMQQQPTNKAFTETLAYLEDTSGYVLYTLASTTGRPDDLNKAVNDITSALNRTADNPELSKDPATLKEMEFHLGMAQYFLGRRGPAAETLRRALEGDFVFPGRDEAANCLALLKVNPKTDPPKPAVDLVEKRLRAKPHDPIALRLRGDFALRDRAFDQAAQSYEASLKMAADPEVMVTLAELYLSELKKPARAKELAQNARQLDQSDPRVAGLLGRLRLDAGEYGYAATLLQEAANATGDPDTRFAFARAVYALGHVDESEQALRQAKDAFASKPSTNADEAARFLRLVEAAKNEKDAVSAKEDAQKALAANANYLPALMVMGMAEKGSDPKKAAQTFEGVLAKYPQFSPAVRELAFIYSKLGDPQRANEFASRARQSYPDDDDLRKLQGMLTYQVKEYSRAKTIFEELGIKPSSDPESFYLGMAYFQLRKWDDAKAYLAVVVKSPKLDPKQKEEATKALGQMPQKK